MSGRGKGGKGLGKGGAKRHRKILRDNIQGTYPRSSTSLTISNTYFILSNLLRYYKACYPPSCSPRWCKAYLWSYLRRDPWCSQDFPWKCVFNSFTPISAVFSDSLSFLGHPWLSNLHWTRQAQDCNCTWCRIRTQAFRAHFIWFRCMILFSYSFLFRFSSVLCHLYYLCITTA